MTCQFSLTGLPKKNFLCKSNHYKSSLFLLFSRRGKRGKTLERRLPKTISHSSKHVFFLGGVSSCRCQVINMKQCRTECSTDMKTLNTGLLNKDKIKQKLCVYCDTSSLVVLVFHTAQELIMVSFRGKQTPVSKPLYTQLKCFPYMEFIWRFVLTQKKMVLVCCICHPLLSKIPGAFGKHGKMFSLIEGDLLTAMLLFSRLGC